MDKALALRRILKTRFGFITVLVLCALCLGSPLRAQSACTGGSSVLQGTVRDDSTGAAIGGTWVVLLLPMCRTATDAAGRFRFDHLPAGIARIDAGHAGYRRFEPVDATLSAGQTTEVVLRLRPGGPIEDCRVNGACAQLLREPMLPNASEEEQFRLAAQVTMIAIAWEGVGNQGWVACIEEFNARVIAELKKRYGAVAPAAECQMWSGIHDRMKHLPTARPAFRVRIDGVEHLRAGLRRAALSYAVAGLWGAGWSCNFARVPGGWRPILCVGVVEA